jgi:hypothetical protein
MLRPITTGLLPIGTFDGYDADILTIKGGEVLTIASVALPSSDLAAADVLDGYAGTTAKTRAILTKTLSATSRVLFLADDGNAGYGTLFGTLVGGIAGQQVAGPRIGPATATGSGKITAWNSKGLYAVSLDAVNTAADGIVPSNTSLTAGSPLTATAAGLLSPVGAAAGTFNAGQVVATFVEFSVNNGSKVSTPGSRFNEAVIYWIG